MFLCWSGLNQRIRSGCAAPKADCDITRSKLAFNYTRNYSYDEVVLNYHATVTLQVQKRESVVLVTQNYFKLLFLSIKF